MPAGAAAAAVAVAAGAQRRRKSPLLLPEKEARVPGLEALQSESPSITSVQGPSGVLYHSTSLFCLRVCDEPRRSCIRLVEASFFDPVILLTIMSNCVTMAWESPLDPSGTSKAAFIDVCEWIYLYIFTAELVAKIVARGFLLHDHSYLRDAWCQLDFVVVSLAWIPIIFPSFGNYSVIRSVRALRPLRALKRVPGMPVLISSIMAAFPKLGTVVSLCGFVFLIFGIVGMELFKGSLHYRCALPGYVEPLEHPISERRALGLLIEPESGGISVGKVARETTAVVAAVAESAAETITQNRALQSSSSTGTGNSIDPDFGSRFDGGWLAARASSSSSSRSRSRSSNSSQRRHLKGSGGVGGGGGAPTAGTGVPQPKCGESSRRSLKGGGGKAADSGDGAGQAAHYGEQVACSNFPESSFDTGMFCSPSRDTASTPGSEACERQLPGLATRCAYFEYDVNFGLTSFDSVGLAFISLLQSITFDTWTEAMYGLSEAFSPAAAVAFFLLMVALGGFFVVNLFLAVIFQEFIAAQAMEAANAEMAQKAVASAAMVTVAASRFRAGGCAAGKQATTSESRTCDGEAVVAAHSAPLEYSFLGGPPSAAPATTAPAGALSPTNVAFAEDVKVGHVALLPPGAEASDGRRRRGGSCWDCRNDDALSHFLLPIVNASWFGNASTALVLINMGLMCMPYEGMSDDYSAGIESAASVISWIFIVEMALKLLAMGCEAYWSDNWNVLDGTIVSLSIFEMIMTALASGSGVKLSFLRMLRMLRVLRMLRLMRSWKGLYTIVMTFGKALPQLQNLFVLMFLVAVIFSLLGMQIFGGAFRPSTGFYSGAEPCPHGVCPPQDGIVGLKELPRYNYDYFMPAMLTTFICMTGIWVDLMLPSYEALGGAAIGFFVSLVLIGSYLMMNLFIAILLNSFAESGEEAEKGSATPEEKMVSLRALSADASASGASGEDVGDGDKYQEYDEEQGGGQRSEGELTVKDGQKSSSGRDDYALLCFGPRNPLRLFARALTAHPAFDSVIIGAIVASSVCLAMDSPRLDANSELAATLRSLDLVWTALFAAELLLKVIALTFCTGPHAYVRSPWNLLDLAIVCVSFLVLLAEVFPVLHPLKTLRILRVLRPLRLVSRNPGMKLIMTSLAKALPAVSNTMAVIFAFQLVFAILGMQLFMGALSQCTDPTLPTRELCHPPDTLPPPPIVGDEGSNLGLGRRLGLLEPQPTWAPGVSQTLPSQYLPAQPMMPATSPPSALPPLLQHLPQPPRLLPVAFVEDVPSRAPLEPVASKRQRRRLKGGGGAKQTRNAKVQWANPPVGSFDDFGSAMLLLYIMSTGDGWDSLMFATMDTTTPGHAHKRNDFSGACIFSVLWMFTGSFFALNLFVGVIVRESTQAFTPT